MTPSAPLYCRTSHRNGVPVAIIKATSGEEIAYTERDLRRIVAEFESHGSDATAYREGIARLRREAR